MLETINRWGRPWRLTLQLFAEGDAAEGEASGGPATAESAEVLSAVGNGETTLEDGTRVDKRLAERTEKLEKKTGKKILQRSTGSQDQQPAQNQPDQTQPEQKTPEQEFDELIKGKYAKQYQERFQQGLNDRFRNQADLQAKLDGMKPMLDALAKQRGIEPGNVEALSNAILDDDSLYEDEAEKHGMTVEAYKSFRKLEAEAEQARKAQAENQKQQMVRQHLQELSRQGEALKKTFPNFDLQTELKDPTFRRMTAPNSGLTVEQAYYAVHHAELAPQAMQAGIARAKQQIAQTMQANAARPAEGALQSSATASNLTVNPKTMTRKEREEINRRVRMGEKITF